MSSPIEEQYIKSAEEKIDGRFPHSYRQMMKEKNGGDIVIDGDKWELYPILNAASKELYKQTFDDLVSETESVKKWFGFPENAIAIASNGRGDRLIFLRESRSKYSEKIYEWDHESTKVSLIEKSFKKLLQR